MSFAYFRDRQYGRPGMGEIVCIGLQVNLGTEVSMAVILSVGVRYFAPRRTLSIIWRHFWLLGTVGGHGTAISYGEARDAARYPTVHRIPQSVPLPEIIGFNMTAEQRVRNLDLEARRWFSWKQRGDFPGGSVVKNLPANAGDTGSIPGPGDYHMPWSIQTWVPQVLSLCSIA